MGIKFDARGANARRLIELLEEAQEVADMLQQTVTVETDTGKVEVPPYEEDTEREKTGKPSPEGW